MRFCGKTFCKNVQTYETVESYQGSREGGGGGGKERFISRSLINSVLSVFIIYVTFECFFFLWMKRGRSLHTRLSHPPS